MAALSGSKSRSRGGPELKNRKLKEQAIAFYNEHDVPAKLEHLLNQLFPSPPPDLYGYMSEYFRGLSKEPVVSRLLARRSLDSTGGPALEVDVHCIVNGVEKFVARASTAIAVDPQSSDQKAPTDPDSQQSIADPPHLDPLESVSKQIGPALKGTNVKDQRLVDEKMQGLNSSVHPSAIAAVSMAVAEAASLLQTVPLHTHLLAQYQPLLKSKYSLPIPVVSALSGGAGKLKFREFCLVALPTSGLHDQVVYLTSVHREIGKFLSLKQGASGLATLASGAYCPTLDKPEQAMDILQEAVKNGRLTLGESLAVLVDVGAERIFDKEKCKYEVSNGQWKTTEDLISLYVDLASGYPGVLGYVDPLSPRDVEGWVRLQERLGDKCLLVADRSHEDLLPLLSVHKQPQEGEGESLLDGRTTPTLECLSCVTLSVETTLSDFVSRHTSLKGHCQYTMLRTPLSLAHSTSLADLAVATQCSLLRLTAPTGVASSGLLSRMLQISEELVAQEKYEPGAAFVFKCKSSEEQT